MATKFFLFSLYKSCGTYIVVIIYLAKYVIINIVTDKFGAKFI